VRSITFHPDAVWKRNPATWSVALLGLKMAAWMPPPDAAPVITAGRWNTPVTDEARGSRWGTTLSTISVIVASPMKVNLDGAFNAPICTMRLPESRVKKFLPRARSRAWGFVRRRGFSARVALPLRVDIRR
jgi:hypothetical protein